MNSMMPKFTDPYAVIVVSAAALLSGCVTSDQAPPRIAQNDPHAVRSAFQEKATASDGAFIEAQYFPYEKGALYQLRAAVGSPGTIELQPGETLINYALGDGSLWIVDDVDGAEQTLLQVEPTQPDLSTHLLINTDKRSYLVEATSHQGDAPEAALAWIYPHEQVDQRITAVEAENERLDETVAASFEGNALQLVTMNCRRLQNIERPARLQAMCQSASDRAPVSEPKRYPLRTGCSMPAFFFDQSMKEVVVVEAVVMWVTR